MKITFAEPRVSTLDPKPVEKPERNGWLTYLGILSGLGLLMIAFNAGASLAAWTERRDAYKAGVGHYICDPKTGEAEFIYGKESSP
jgi:hypothetical protein